MRKLIVLCSLMIFMMSGCTSTKKDDNESMKNYESYIDAAMSNNGVETKIIPFDYKLNVYKQKNKTYQYELIVNNPRTAMYNIQAIAVNPEIDSNTNIHPCLGLLGEDAQMKFHMVPFQSNPVKNFIPGFSLEGVSSESQFTLYVMVMWKDSTQLKNTRVFFNANFALEADDTANGKKETVNADDE